jgi:hypothetical protein
MKRLGASMIWLFVLAGCGGATAAPGPTASVNGSVGGQSFNVVDEIGQVWTTHVASGSSVSSAGVVLSSVAGTCTIAERHGNPPNVTTLGIAVEQDGSSVGSGTYAVGQGVAASYEVIDAECKGARLEQATAGTVTLTTSTSEWVVGSFDLMFDSGDHLTGTFSAPVCSDLLFQSAWRGTCGS